MTKTYLCPMSDQVPMASYGLGVSGRGDLDAICVPKPAVFLASAKAAWTTGVIFDVAGDAVMN